jgi:HK97 family phage portal protein
MGMLKRMLSPRGGGGNSRSMENPSVGWEGLADLDSLSSDAGERVNVRRALSIPAFWQGVSAISGDVAKLPLGTYRRLENGGRTLERNHHAFRRISLGGMANDEVNAYKFWRRMMVSALTYNNGYAYIDKNPRGEVLGLYNLLPDRTTPVRMKGRVWYLTEVGGKLEAIQSTNILHIEGLSIDNLAGIDLVKEFRELFGAALAKRKFASKFFSQGMTAGGVLAVPPSAKPESVKKVQAGIKDKFSNTDNAFKTIVLRDGYKWYSTQIDPQKAQMNQATEQDAREVARILNVKASRLSVDGSTSYNSDEMAQRDYYDGCLSHWLIGTRSETNHKLRTPEEIEADEVFLDYNINALMWADANTRSQIANAGIVNGRFSPNETRAWENLNPYDGGEQFYQPLNVAPVGQTQASAARQLALDTVQRMRNRLAIRWERSGKTGTLDSERDQVTDMLRAAAVILDSDPVEMFDQLVGEVTNGVE